MKNNLGRNRCCDIPNPPKGDSGKKGPGGEIGTMGTTGPVGTIGQIGPTGLCYRGPQGPKGPQGPLDGITGPTGTPGSYIINYNSYFSASPGGIYNNIIFTTLGSTNILLPLSNQKWAISWEIVENWQDTGNQFYVRLREYYNPLINYSPHTFTSGHPYYLYPGNNNASMYGSGNDFLDLTGTSETDFVIELRQKTTSGGPVLVSGSLTFNITFTQII
jgi:hypothetical protein